MSELTQAELDRMRFVVESLRAAGLSNAGNYMERLLAEVERLRVLARLVTVRQVINAGDEAIQAAGLNPWALNEGLATGDERIDP